MNSFINLQRKISEVILIDIKRDIDREREREREIVLVCVIGYFISKQGNNWISIILGKNHIHQEKYNKCVIKIQMFFFLRLLSILC